MIKINNVYRILLAIGAIVVIASYFLPLWQIQLWAPQYPEGLAIQIWHNDLKGEVNIINGLNHYIGMKMLKPEMFPEFKYLRYIIAGFIFFTLFIAWKGTLKWLKIYCVVITIAGLIVLADFYRWGYDYGHNLDPHAPIQVPGMAYQPPVIGYKVLLNFTALSMPDSGGWIIVAIGALAYGILLTEIIKHKKMAKSSIKVASIIIATLVLVSCGSKTPSINFGKDNCDFCKMTIMDNKFGAIITTDKGRIYKFDDFNCKQRFVSENNPIIKMQHVVLYNKPANYVLAESAFYKQSLSIKSPMGSGAAAFENKESCESFTTEENSSCYDFNNFKLN